MPWRCTKDPYRIFVSELMLQQTQVARVRIKYDAFLKKFPTVHALARASLADVLRLWSGLGYNRRAKHLHRCALNVASEHNGKFPDRFDELLKLPGIGISTAAALCSFSFGQDEPMIDTNIRRILSRVFFGGRVMSDKDTLKFGRTVIPKGKGRAWNYAMLDLGATVCTARRHGDACPLDELHGAVGDFAYKKPQARFIGSRRYYRGRILGELLKNGPQTIRTLSRCLDISKRTTSEIVADLHKEQLIDRYRGKIELPS